MQSWGVWTDLFCFRTQGGHWEVPGTAWARQGGGHRHACLQAPREREEPVSNRKQKRKGFKQGFLPLKT